MSEIIEFSDTLKEVALAIYLRMRWETRNEQYGRFEHIEHGRKFVTRQYREGHHTHHFFSRMYGDNVEDFVWRIYFSMKTDSVDRTLKLSLKMFGGDFVEFQKDMVIFRMFNDEDIQLFRHEQRL
jgi:hypothetical protein